MSGAQHPGEELVIREVPCESIRIGERHRKDMGDLNSLASSIEQEGLLQPIGITEDNILVFGERRLRAITDVLKRQTIQARVVHVSSIVAGEHDENELRKAFTPSERVAIANALANAIPKRVGRPDGAASREIMENFPEFKGCVSRDLAAEKAGLGSGRTYDQAKKVVKRGVPQLVAAMDSCELSIDAAFRIATQPPQRQVEILALPIQDRRAVVRNLRESRGPVRDEPSRKRPETRQRTADTQIPFTPEAVLASPDSHSTQQRAIAAAMFLPSIREEARRARRLERTNPTGVLANVPDQDVCGDARGVAARLFGCHAQTICHAARILRDAPANAARVARGEISLEAAHKLVKQAVPSKVQQNTDNAAKRRMVDTLTQVSGLCTGLLRIDIAGARKCCTPGETTTWAAEAQNAVKQLREFARMLRGAEKRVAQ